MLDSSDTENEKDVDMDDVYAYSGLLADSDQTIGQAKSSAKNEAKKAKNAKKVKHVITEEDEDKAAMEYSIGLAETADKIDKPKEKEEDDEEDLHLDFAEQILNNNKPVSGDEEDANSRPISEGEKQNIQFWANKDVDGSKKKAELTKKEEQKIKETKSK